MAKNPDHLAGSFDTGNTGGVLSGFLAEENEFDRSALWRLGSWGIGSVVAVVVAVMANQSSLGYRREQMASVDLVQQANRLQSVARESQNEARRLSSAIDTLNSDRDRLYSRVTVLEQGLDSVTGAIAKQNLPAAAPPAAAAEPDPVPAVGPVATTQAVPAEKPAGASSSEQAPANVSSIVKETPRKDAGKKPAATPATPPVESKSIMAPAMGPVATTQAVPAEKAAGAPSGEQEPVNVSSISRDAPRKDAGKKPAATPATPLVEAKSFMAPPDPAAGKLIEPERPASAVASAPMPEVMASAPSAEDIDANAEALPIIQRTEFGVDVGSANSIAGLRALWRGLLKSRANAPLLALRPIIVIKEGTGGLGMQLRLVAGPLRDAAAAAKICAALTENKRACDTAVFDGQRLSLGADDEQPAATKPVPSRKRGAAKRSAFEEPARKRETTAASTISSFFGKKSNQ